MAIAIDVKGDLRAIERDLTKVQRKVVPQAAARALNRVNGTVKTRLVRSLQAIFGAPNQKQIKRQVKIPKRLRATAKRLRAGALASLYMPQVLAPHGSKFYFSGGPRPVGALSLFPAVMPSGHRGVFVRIGGERWTRGRKHSSSANLPIKEIFTAQTERALMVAAPLIAAAGADWRRIVTAELKFRLERRGLA